MPNTALTLNQLLTQAVALQASDLHLSAGRAPMMRHDGALVTLEATTPTPHVLTHDALRMMLTPLMDEAQHAQRCSNGRSYGGCV